VKGMAGVAAGGGTGATPRGGRGGDWRAVLSGRLGGGGGGGGGEGRGAGGGGESCGVGGWGWGVLAGGGADGGGSVGGGGRVLPGRSVFGLGCSCW